MKHEIERYPGELRRLREAAQAVVNRWETPSWKDVPATAHYIDALRLALTPLKQSCPPCNHNCREGRDCPAREQP